MKEVIIYTDGACSGNPGPGGWGAISALQAPSPPCRYIDLVLWHWDTDLFEIRSIQPYVR